MHKKMKKKILTLNWEHGAPTCRRSENTKNIIKCTYLLPNIYDIWTPGGHLFLVQTVIMLEVRMGRIEADIQD